jgi:hypothetical protein
VTEHQALVLAVVLMGRRENLTAAILRDGDIIEGPQGPKVHPAVSELRQVSATIGRLLSQLGLEDADGESMPSPLTVVRRKGAAAQRAARAEAAGSVSALASAAVYKRWHPDQGA